MKSYLLTFLIVITYVTLLAQENSLSFKDPRDGQTYKIVKIGEQWWMAENLNFKSENSWCYNDSAQYCKQYGRLYDWDAATKVCPTGWHLPTEKEWLELELFIGFPEDELYMIERDGDTFFFDSESIRGWFGDSAGMGAVLKSKLVWSHEDLLQADLIGFNALPAGYRQYMIIMFLFHKLKYKGLKTDAAFWASTSYSKNYAQYRYLNSEKDGVFRGNYFKRAAFSVRCVKD